MILVRTTLAKRGYFGVHLNQKIQNQSRNGRVRAVSAPLRSTFGKGDPNSNSFDLYQNDSKLVKKWLYYGHFLPERLCDYIEKHMGQKGRGCSSV